MGQNKVPLSRRITEISAVFPESSRIIEQNYGRTEDGWWLNNGYADSFLERGNLSTYAA